MVKTITIDWKTYTLTPVEDNMWWMDKEEKEIFDNVRCNLDENLWKKHQAEVFAESGGLCYVDQGSTTTATEKNLCKEKKLRYKVGDEVFIKWSEEEEACWRRTIKTIERNWLYWFGWFSVAESEIDHEKTAAGKPKEVKSWEDLGEISWYHVDDEDCTIKHREDVKAEYNKYWCLRATKEQAEASIAMAQLSQLMKNVNGDWKPDRNERKTKYIIYIRLWVVDVWDNWICGQSVFYWKRFLSFPTREIRDTFLENHRELIEKCKPLL